MDRNDMSLGEPVQAIAPMEPPRLQVYDGQFVTLQPIQAEADVDDLYNGSHGNPTVETLWTYMSYGPFADRQEMQQWLAECQASTEPLFLVAIAKELACRVGMTSFCSIVPEMRRLEIGNIWYVPAAQNTKVNTEAAYLMLREAFDEQHYRRVEWKCNAFNIRSRNAALRLGFSYEGTFKQHTIVKGRNRDTAWFAMLDSDRPTAKENMERWLYADEPEVSLWSLNQPYLRRPM
jgi:RimJ/RimL family protein N-acetyltransferase